MQAPVHTTSPVLKSQLKIIIFALIIGMGSLEMGYYLVMVSVIADPIAQHNGLPPAQLSQKLFLQLSLATAALPLGGTIGSLIYKKLINAMKSENTLMLLCDISIIIICILNLITLEIRFLITLRLFIGIVIGVSSVLTPMYLISISPSNLSGIIGSLNQLFISVGIAIGYGMGFLIQYSPFQEYQSYQAQALESHQNFWRIYVILPVLFCSVRILGTKYFSFDCLERHIRNNDTEKLKEYISQFYVQNTLSLQQLISSKTIDHPAQSFYTPYLKSMKRRNTIAVCFCILNQFCGINAIILYANQLFEELSDGNEPFAILMSFCLGVLQIIFTVMGGLLLDRFGRKNLVVFGTFLVIVSLVIGFFILEIDLLDNKLASYAMLLHIAVFSLSIGPITVLYISQIVEDVSPYMTLIWVETMIISLSSNLMMEQIGLSNVLLFYGVISGGCLVYITNNMIESKGKSRKQLEIEYERGLREGKYEEVPSSISADEQAVI